MRLNKSYEFPADNVTIPTDETSIERGASQRRPALNVMARLGW
jgi:hypothetical protein